jgi:hypothetical protein
MIYLSNYCTRTKRSLGECWLKAWYQVKERDWLKNMPLCDVCGKPIPVADMVRVGNQGLVHMKCAGDYLERAVKQTVNNDNQTK